MLFSSVVVVVVVSVCFLTSEFMKRTYRKTHVCIMLHLGDICNVQSAHAPCPGWFIPSEDSAPSIVLRGGSAVFVKSTSLLQIMSLCLQDHRVMQ